MNWVFYAWLALFVILALLVGHRIFMVNLLIDFEADRKRNPIEASARLNRYRNVELILHLILSMSSLILPERSFVLFLLNMPLVLWAYYLFTKKKLHFSPYQMVRDAENSQNQCFIYLSVFILSAFVIIVKLLQTSIKKKT